MTIPDTIADAAEQLRDETITSVDLVEHCLGRIDALEPQVRAWVVVDRAGARRAAEQADDELSRGIDRGLLHGIPIGVKDIIDVAGLPTLAGSRVREAVPVSADAFIVAKLREAGAVILGKTVTTEFASFDPPPTCNPWNLERTPGGSSSGSAAAAATGMCYAALGSQTGGSIVRPASYCGVAGLKPTWGRVSLSGIVPLAFHLDHPGPIARTVDDLDLMFRAIAGYDAADACSSALGGAGPNDDVLQTEYDWPAAPRLGVVREFFEERASAEVRRVAGEAIEKLRQAGADVQPVALPAEFADVHRAHRLIMAVEAAAYHRETFLERRSEYGSRIAALIEEGLAATTTDYARALQHQLKFRRAIERLFEAAQVDHWIMPSVSNTAPTAETTGEPSFQAPWSHSGLPVVSLPCGLGDDGLPICVQLIGPAWSEGPLLATAKWCETAFRFAARPALLAGA